MEETTVIPENIPIPSDFDPKISYLGEPIFNEDLNEWTYEVIHYTQAQLRNIEVARIKSRGEQIIERKIKDDALNFFQSLPAEDALQNKEVYPMWSQELEFVLAGHKYLDIVDGELVLYEVVQSHAPKDFPFTIQELASLWKRVALPDQILDWAQPLGAFDAYQIGDRVNHNGSTWESTFANNVWEPGVFGWVKI
jgi:hypothetical protein